MCKLAHVHRNNSTRMISSTTFAGNLFISIADTKKLANPINSLLPQCSTVTLLNEKRQPPTWFDVPYMSNLTQPYRELLPCWRPAEQPVHPGSVKDAPVFFFFDMDAPVLPVAPQFPHYRLGFLPVSPRAPHKGVKCTSLRQTLEAFAFTATAVPKATDFIRK